MTEGLQVVWTDGSADVGSSADAGSDEPAAAQDFGLDIQEAFRGMEAYCARSGRLGLRERFLVRIVVRRAVRRGRVSVDDVGVERMKRALDGAEASTKEVFLMHRREGMTYAQISRRTGLPIGVIEKHVANALTILADVRE